MQVHADGCRAQYRHLEGVDVIRIGADGISIHLMSACAVAPALLPEGGPGIEQDGVPRLQLSCCLEQIICQGMIPLLTFQSRPCL